ncbi:MAG: rubrerythrin family protein [Ruminococcus sp.]|nr:rubrerythrin family protein [Ruminococcus sp.]
MQTIFCKSETKTNLMRAFAGECQSRQRYYQAALIAQQQEQIVLERMFRFTAEQEERHAKQFFELLSDCAGDKIEIAGSYPASVFSDIGDLLKASADEEYHESKEVYPEFAAKAREEGFADIAAKFEMIAKIEESHQRRFEYYYSLWNKDMLQRSDSTDETWMCLNCGHIYKGSEPPNECPVCGAKRGYFIRKNEAPFTDANMYK